MGIKSKLQKEGYCADDIDDIVIAAAIELASESNNGGMKEQIRFLNIICGYTDEEIYDIIKK
jgi:hypothetical protein